MPLSNRLSRKVCDPLRLSPPNISNWKVHTPLEEPMNRQNLLTSRFALALSALLVILLFSSVAFAQAGTATVRGTVTDPQGNVVSGATVTLINPATTASRTAATSDSGVYSFELVSPGDYRVEVEARGFKKAVITNV